MNDSGTDSSSRIRRSRRAEDDESTLRYRLRNQNFCLVVFFIVVVITVACACTAIVAAVVEHFWTSINDADEPQGTAVAQGSVEGAKSVAVDIQRQSDDESGRAVFCFVNLSLASGSPYRFSMDNVSSILCDALVFVSVGLDPSQSGLRFRRPTEDAEALQSLVSLGTPAWACVGGEPSDSVHFRKVVRDKRSRLAFIHNAAAWTRRLGLVGLVLYWKYPTIECRSNYSTLVSTMRVIFERDAIRVSVIVPWQASKRRHGYNVHTTYSRLDFVVVDTHRTVDPSSFPVTTCQSPMRAVFRARHNGQMGLSSVLDDLSMVTDHQLSKTMLSVSCASVTFTMKRPWIKIVRAGMTALGPGQPFGYTNRSGLASYYEVTEALTRNASWHRQTHGFSRCTVAHSGDQWIGFEDSTSLRYKRSLVRKTSGLAVWDLPMDDFAGDFGPTWPLLREARDLVHG
ncbi:chitinase-like protein 3 [Haemaphysalis longicornis]